MRKIYIAGNWKMNKNFSDAEEFLGNLQEFLQENKLENIETMICPAFPYLEMATDFAEECSLSIGAQNVSQYETGAYTGEISADMLSSLCVEYCLVGHSERRHIFGETSQMINEKIKRLRSFYIKPVLCIGETLQQREDAQTFDVITSQLAEGLKDIKIDNDLIIAYEPVWAIGTGKTATPQQAQEVHAFIRKWLADNYNAKTAEQTPVLYGGSVKPANIKELLAEKDIDGGLIGGAALKLDSYLKMIDIARQI